MPLRNQGKRLLCSFRLVLEEKAGKEIPVIKNKFLTRDQYQLPQTTWIRQHLRTTKRGSVADLLQKTAFSGKL